MFVHEQHVRKTWRWASPNEKPKKTESGRRSLLVFKPTCHFGSGQDQLLISLVLQSLREMLRRRLQIIELHHHPLIVKQDSCLALRWLSSRFFCFFLQLFSSVVTVEPDSNPVWCRSAPTERFVVGQIDLRLTLKDDVSFRAWPH